MEFEILGHTINSLMPFIKHLAKNKDAREWVNAVHFKLLDKGDGTYIECSVTSGTFLAILTVKHLNDVGTSYSKPYLSIPVSVLANMAFKDDKPIKFSYSNGICTLTVGDTCAYIQVSPTPTRDLIELVPEGELSGGRSHLDIELLSLFASCWRALTKTKNKRITPRVRLEHNGPKRAARITFNGYPEFVGVLMPFVMQGD